MRRLKSNPSLKTIYFWNLLGNLAASGVSVLYLLIVTRLTSVMDADRFSLAWSIGNLWIVIGLFQVRNYHGTDVQKKHSFTGYFQTRIVTILAMLLTLLPYLQIVGRGEYSWSTIALVSAVVLYRTWDAISDLSQGLFQQRERMDLAGKSMFYRYASSTTVLLICLLFSKSLLLSVLALVIWNGLFIIFYEFPMISYFERIVWRDMLSSRYFHEIKDILKACFPLFFNGFILLYVLNEPKLIIEQGMNEGIFMTGMQRDFNILFMPVFFMSLIILIVRPLITQLALLYSRGAIKEFDTIVRKLLFFISLGGLFVVFLSYFIGADVLGIIFGVDLIGHQLSFSILIFAGVLYALSIVFENILTIMRKQHLLISIYILILIVSKIITKNFIYNWGMIGTSISFLLVMVVYLLGVSLIYFWEQRRITNDL